MFARIEDGEIVDRRDQPLAEGDWRPIVVADREPFDPEMEQEAALISVEGDRVLVTYTIVPRTIMPSEVKAEAARRIEAILPDYKQRNALAFGLEAVMAHGPDPAKWPKELQAMNAALQAKWAAIKAIRARSDEIEAMQPVPADFRDDKRWP